MKPDRRGLQSWYREAMLSRIDELVDLRDRVAAGSADAIDGLRKVGQALRGSGGTFGFPELSAVAGLVESTPDQDAARRLEGLLVELRRLVGGKRGEEGRVHEWLALCAGLEGDTDVPDASGTAGAWASVARSAGLAEPELAEAVAKRFGLSIAELAEPGKAAWRLVPEAFMMAEDVVPLVEDSETITVATADPVALATELELERLTGRRPVFAVAPPEAIRAVLEGSIGGDSHVAPSPLPSPPPAEAAGGTAPPSGASVSDGASAPHGVASKPGSRPGGPTEVLVVDDEAGARLLIRTLLEKRGFQAVEAGDGVEALDKIRSHDGIGLAVVDLNMPRMDGLELMWAIRDSSRWAHLPVIVVTGEKDEILETQIMEEGADDYVRKPLDPRLFVARVEATLRRSAPGSPA